MLEPAARAAVDGHEAVDDRCDPEPRQERELEEVLRVAQVHVGRAQEDAQRAGEQQQAQEREREERDVRPGDVPLDAREHGEQHEALQEEVDDHAGDGRERQDLTRERNLLHEPRVPDHREAGPGQTGREEVPHEQAGEQVDREGGNTRAEDLHERDVEDDEVQQRVQQ